MVEPQFSKLMTRVRSPSPAFQKSEIKMRNSELFLHSAFLLLTFSCCARSSTDRARGFYPLGCGFDSYRARDAKAEQFSLIINKSAKTEFGFRAFLVTCLGFYILWRIDRPLLPRCSLLMAINFLHCTVVRTSLMRWREAW